MQSNPLRSKMSISNRDVTNNSSSAGCVKTYHIVPTHPSFITRGSKRSKIKKDWHLRKRPRAPKRAKERVRHFKHEMFATISSSSRTRRKDMHITQASWTSRQPKHGSDPGIGTQMQKMREKKAKRQKRGSAPGIEPGTSSTLKTNHTPRPSGLSCSGEESCLCYFTFSACRVTILKLYWGSLFLCIWRAVTVYLSDGSSCDFVGDQGRGGRDSTMIFYVGISIDMFGYR